MRNKHSVRVTLDPATDHALQDLARRQARPVANMAFALIKAGLESHRAQQRPHGIALPALRKVVEQPQR
jgi:hypothetical protein